jgi:Tfp pilus assembly pilus retraction ATPase PilT
VAEIDKLLMHLKEAGGSDLHLVAGLEPRLRAKGRIGVIDGWGVLDDERLRDLMREIATTKSWE